MSITFHFRNLSQIIYYSYFGSTKISFSEIDLRKISKIYFRWVNFGGLVIEMEFLRKSIFNAKIFLFSNFVEDFLVGRKKIDFYANSILLDDVIVGTKSSNSFKSHQSHYHILIKIYKPISF